MPIDIGKASMEDLSEGNPLIYAALVALRKQLSTTDEIRLTPLDFETWSSAGADGVLFNYEADTSTIVLRHVSGKDDA